LEVVVQARLILAGVKKMWEGSRASVEKKGVSRSPNGVFCRVSEEAVSKGLREISQRARGEWDARRLTGSGAFTTWEE
jgi:hypothetical protein